MTITLTEKETTMLKAFVQEGIDCCGFEGMTADDLIDDNMTYNNADDLKDSLGWTKQEIGGVMSALSDKGLIFDCGDSPRSAQTNDWFASDEAIRWFFDSGFRAAE